MSYDEKKLLNIEDDVSSDKLNDFKENTKLEEGIKEDYENYTRIDPEWIVNRKLIYTPIEKDKNEDTDGRRTALGEKGQLYDENSSDQAKNVDEESSKVYENVEDNENIIEEQVINEKHDENSNKNDMTSLELSSDNKVYIENDEIKVIDEAATSEVYEEDSVLKDANENLEENQNCEDENFETSKTADDHKEMPIVESSI